MKWEYMSKKIGLMAGDTSDVTIDSRIKNELDTPGEDGWELVSVIESPGAYVRAFYKRELAGPTVIA